MTGELPTLELLEARHNFPCPYTFKVIGKTGAGLEGRVARCAQDLLGLDEAPSTSVKTAAGGRHESVTVEPTCEGAQTVLDLYAALRNIDGVLFLF